jgi:hypothetical protein
VTSRGPSPVRGFMAAMRASFASRPDLPGQERGTASVDAVLCDQ